MAKKLGRIALFSVLAGAAAAAAYHYLKKKEAAPEDDYDDSDDFDNFDEDLDDDFPDDAVNSANSTTGGKSHIHIPIDLDSAKELIGGKVIETLDRTKERLEQLNVSEKIDRAKEIISDRMSSSAPAPTEYTEMDIHAMDMHSTSSAYSDPENADGSTADCTEEQFFDDTDK